MLNKKLLCTLGPSSFNKKTLCRLEHLGVSLFRINLSHTQIHDLKDIIQFIRSHTKVAICLDTEGAQVRTGRIEPQEKTFLENEIIEILPDGHDSAGQVLTLYPAEVLAALHEGDLLVIDFDSLLIQILSTQDERITARVISGGRAGACKAVNLLRNFHLPCLTDKDKAAIALGLQLDIKHFALSFANSQEDVEYIRQLTHGRAHIISKIESKAGYNHLDQILRVSDAILIDRGDLAREIPISLIPFFQRKIIAAANLAEKEVYVATNLLESMRETRNPNRSEINDVVHALMMGADGLVLAAETAIGKLPIESATMMVRLIKQFQLSQKKDVTQDITDATSMLNEPHGGQLIQRFDENPDWNAIRQMPRLKVPSTTIMDAEQIGTGAYSPLEGFMTRCEIHSVLDSYRISSGAVWSLPIVLQAKSQDVKRFSLGEEAVLVDENDDEIYAVLKIEDIYLFPFDEVSHKWFGTRDTTHPGVHRLKMDGDCFVGGKIMLVKRRRSPFRIYEYSPRELRHIFESKGWSHVVGFHTRNVVHRGHEFIQKSALESTHCDGLFISPVIGSKKTGDFSSYIILKGYQLIIDRGVFPENKVVLGALSTFSRYSGPREAIFTALCRKNFGCSHFIVGRDHTGVGNFYSPYASQKLFDSLGDLGITPVFFDTVSFCPACDDYVLGCAHDVNVRKSLSGTDVRQSLLKRQSPPEWLMRPEVSEMILGQIHEENEIFV